MQSERKRERITNKIRNRLREWKKERNKKRVSEKVKTLEDRKTGNIYLSEISYIEYIYIEVIKELQNTEIKKYRKINKTLTRN